MAQTTTPTYDDDTRCNTAGTMLPQGVYEPLDACQQTGYVCMLASDPSGSVFFWLGKNSDCTEFYTTRIETFYQKQAQPDELDPNHPNHDLRLILAPGIGNSNTFGTAVMASQILSAKSDGAQVSVIYTKQPML